MYESAPWRTELKKHALILREAPHWPGEEKFFDVDRALFYSAFVLRKLIEDRKLTDRFSSSVIPIKTFKNIAPSVDSIWRDMPGSVEIDWDSCVERSVSLVEICNQIIHSLTIIGWGDEDESITGYLVSSYRSQDNRSLLIDFSQWSEILCTAADDWPTKLWSSVGPKGPVKIVE